VTRRSSINCPDTNENFQQFVDDGPAQHWWQPNVHGHSRTTNHGSWLPVKCKKVTSQRPCVDNNVNGTANTPAVTAVD